MTEDGQAILMAIVIIGVMVCLVLERISRAIEKRNEKPIGKSPEVEELDRIAHFLMQIRDELHSWRPKEPVDPAKFESAKQALVSSMQGARKATMDTMRKTEEFLNKLD
jgi:hypothetical protein